MNKEDVDKEKQAQERVAKIQKQLESVMKNLNNTKTKKFGDKIGDTKKL